MVRLEIISIKNHNPITKQNFVILKYILRAYQKPTYGQSIPQGSQQNNLEQIWPNGIPHYAYICGYH